MSSKSAVLKGKWNYFLLFVFLFYLGEVEARGKDSEISGSRNEKEDPDVREAVRELVPDIGAEDEEAYLNLSLEEESFIILEYRTLLLSSGFQANPGAGL